MEHFYFDYISAEDVNLLDLKQTCNTLIFIPETWIYFVGQAVTSKPSSQLIWLKV